MVCPHATLAPFPACAAPLCRPAATCTCRCMIPSYDMVHVFVWQEVFETAGPVVSLRMIRDKDTGQPKGIGFCEYRDVECAQAAIRILHNYEMNGRLLSVDHAQGNLDQSSAGPSITRLAERGQQGADANEGKQAGSEGGAGSGDMYNQTNNMTARQMYELIKQLKGHVENKDQAKALMTQNHLLCCEFLRMQERLGMLTGINLPAPPVRAPAPKPAPVPPAIDHAPYAQNAAPAPGMGWNVPQVEQPYLRPAAGMDAGGGGPPMGWNVPQVQPPHMRPVTMDGGGSGPPPHQHAGYDEPSMNPYAPQGSSGAMGGPPGGPPGASGAGNPGMMMTAGPPPGPPAPYMQGGGGGGGGYMAPHMQQNMQNMQPPQLAQHPPQAQKAPFDPRGPPLPVQQQAPGGTGGDAAPQGKGNIKTVYTSLSS
jgi:cleavage stimulation factor subunit 2